MFIKAWDNIVILEIKKLTKTYSSPSGDSERTVLSDIDLTVNRGESVAITGPSGSGKSTLLNIIGTLDSPTSGSVSLDGEDTSTLSPKELSQIRSTRIGFIFQLHHLLPQCTVLENVLIPTIPFISPSGDTETRAVSLLERVGMGEHLHHQPSQLSGGEQQRVAVVRALINNPKLLLADEPTGSLDEENSKNLVELLLQLNEEEQTALICVTHSQEIADLMKTRYKLVHGNLS